MSAEQEAWKQKQAYALQRACEVFAPLVAAEYIPSRNSMPVFVVKTGKAKIRVLPGKIELYEIKCGLTYEAGSKVELFHQINQEFEERGGGPEPLGCEDCRWGHLFWDIARGQVEGFEELYQLSLLEDS